MKKYDKQIIAAHMWRHVLPKSKEGLFLRLITISLALVLGIVTGICLRST